MEKAYKYDVNIDDISDSLEHIYKNFENEKNKTLLAQDICLKATKENVYSKLYELLVVTHLQSMNLESF